MESWLGGGVLLLVAAALWLVYLVPNWLRRSEYLATERNAVRLQQTIRVLAETAEAPEAVRIESAAKARKAVAEALAARPVAVGTAPSLPLPVELDPRARAARRLRRTRLVVTLVMAAGIAALGWQLVVVVQGGMAAGSAMVVAVAGLVVLGGAGLQGRLARASRERAQASRAEPGRSLSERIDAKGETKGTNDMGRRRRTTSSLDIAFDPNVPEDRAWTPQPLPQPLGRVRREAAIAAARAEALRLSDAGEAETVRSVAAARALEAEREFAPVPARAHANAAPAAERSAAPQRPSSSTAARSSVPERASAASETKGTDATTPAPQLSPKIGSPFAAMGVVDVPSGAALDLDGALARRRAS